MLVARGKLGWRLRLDSLKPCILGKTHKLRVVTDRSQILQGRLGLWVVGLRKDTGVIGYGKFLTPVLL